MGAFTVKVFDVFDARIMMDRSPAILIDFNDHTFHDYPIELIIGGFKAQKTQKVGSIGCHQALEVPDSSRESLFLDHQVSRRLDQFGQTGTAANLIIGFVLGRP